MEVPNRHLGVVVFRAKRPCCAGSLPDTRRSGRKPSYPEPPIPFRVPLKFRRSFNERRAVRGAFRWTLLDAALRFGNPANKADGLRLRKAANWTTEGRAMQPTE